MCGKFRLHLAGQPRGLRFGAATEDLIKAPPKPHTRDALVLQNSVAPQGPLRAERATEGLGADTADYTDACLTITCIDL